MIPQTQKFGGYMCVASPFLDVFKAFLQRRFFAKAVFCSGWKKGMLVNDECSSWSYTVGNILLVVWDSRMVILYGDGSAHEVSGPTPLQSVRSMAPNAVYLLHYKMCTLSFITVQIRLLIQL